jgi:hypothetical protein
MKDRTPTDVKLSNLQPHPNNPRLVFREDVVEAIRIQIEEHGFAVEHAVLVRPSNSHLEIISGHQRIEAARRANLSKVPAGVREMDDETALMQLVLANAQGELSPLEIGVHALTAVGRQKGGGVKGGLSEYARQLGKDSSWARHLVQAAEVFQATRSVSQLTDLMFQIDETDKYKRPVILKKAQHLAAIHAADRRAWPALAAAMLKGEWSAKETADHWVPQIQKFEIAERWESVFFTLRKGCYAFSQN